MIEKLLTRLGLFNEKETDLTECRPSMLDPADLTG